ncbi:UNVERIFIED_CONTAM: hypothetical protein GTU68_008614, partial [Idotea baltica]|nr:hypothetical protein [Idotea baltica]
VVKAVNNQRPVNLDLRTIKLPLNAYVSILHRVSGVIIFLGIAVLLCMLDKSLASKEGFDETKTLLSNPVIKFVVWGIISALLYHLIAGIRHLLMDLGIGESLEESFLASKVVLIVSSVAIVLLGVWIW